MLFDEDIDRDDSSDIEHREAKEAYLIDRVCYIQQLLTGEDVPEATLDELLEELMMCKLELDSLAQGD